MNRLYYIDDFKSSGRRTDCESNNIGTVALIGIGAVGPYRNPDTPLQ